MQAAFVRSHGWADRYKFTYKVLNAKYCRE